MKTARLLAIFLMAIFLPCCKDKLPHKENAPKTPANAETMTVVKSIGLLLQEQKQSESFELDSEEGYIRIGHFLDNGMKNAMTVSTAGSGWDFTVYNLENQEWVEMYSQKDVVFSGIQPMQAFVEDYDFDGKMDIGIKNEVSNGTAIMTFRLWLNKGEDGFQYVPEFQDIGNPKIIPGKKIIRGFSACCAFTEINLTDYKWNGPGLRMTDSLHIDHYPYGAKATVRIDAKGKSTQAGLTQKQIDAIIDEYGTHWSIK